MWLDALLHKRYWTFCLIYPYLFHRYRNFSNVWRITEFLSQNSRRDFSFTCVFFIIYMSAIQRGKMQADDIILNCLVATFKIYMYKYTYISVQFSSVAQSCPTLCDPMNFSTPGLPVHHCYPEFTQTHIHRVGDAIQPSHPLSSPSPPALNPSQHQSLFQWVNSPHEVAKVLEFQL